MRESVSQSNLSLSAFFDWVAHPPANDPPFHFPSVFAFCFLGKARNNDNIDSQNPQNTKEFVVLILLIRTAKFSGSAKFGGSFLLDVVA